MRVELIFELNKPELPKDNKSIWISYLKKVLTDCNGGKFFNRYFLDNKMKDYCFSVIFPNPVFEKRKIILQEPFVKMIFSADDRNKTGLIFYSAFIAAKKKKFMLPDGNSMILKSIRQLREKLIVNDRAIFKTVTGGGLVVREHDKQKNTDHYYTFSEEGFLERAEEILKVQAIGAGFSERAAAGIRIKPLQCKKVVVKQYEIYVDVSVGTFQIEANADILQYFYQAGIGSKHSMGYGMLELVCQMEKREEG